MIDKYDEYYFIRQLPVNGLKECGVGWTFHCPFCKENTAHYPRRTAFLLTNDPRYDYNTFSCRRCGTTMSLKSLILDQDQNLYDEYLQLERQGKLDAIREGRRIERKKMEKLIDDIVFDIEYINLNQDFFVPVNLHPPAFQYARKRKIPRSVIERLFWCKKSPDKDPKTGKSLRSCKDMLIFPFYDHQNRIYGYQGRTIKGQKRFHTRSCIGYKVYNIFNVDKTETVWVLEAIIDSTHIPNSIAMLGSDLSVSLLKLVPKRVHVFDNDFTADTFKKIEKKIDAGEKVVIFPESVKENDINQMITQGGMKSSEILQLLKDHTYDGRGAKARIKLMKSKKKRI